MGIRSAFDEDMSPEHGLYWVRLKSRSEQMMGVRITQLRSTCLRTTCLCHRAIKKTSPRELEQKHKLLQSTACNLRKCVKWQSTEGDINPQEKTGSLEIIILTSLLPMKLILNISRCFHDTNSCKTGALRRSAKELVPARIRRRLKTAKAASKANENTADTI